MMVQSQMGEVLSTTKAKTINGEGHIHAKVDGKKDKQLEGLSNCERKYVAPSHTKKIFRNIRSVGKGFSRRITPLFPTMMVQSHMGEDEAVYKDLDDSLVRAATIASSLEAEQDYDNINKTQSKAIPNDSRSQGTDSGGGPRCQEAMGDAIAHTRSERVSKLSNDLLLAREKIKTTQALEIDSLKRRVKKLKKKQRSRTHKLKRLYKVGLTARVESFDDNEDLGKDASKQERTSDIDADEGITQVSTHDDAKMFDADKDLHSEEVFV
nr:hypothetical protein [Tanacetum cinerariifolium]